MADEASNSLSSSRENVKMNGLNSKTSRQNSSDEDIDLETILNGAQLSDKQKFRNKKGKELTVTPVIVDFRRIIDSKCSAQIVPGVDNHELLHAVVGLYDVSLSEMTPDVLYNTVCEKWARTVILLRDIQDTLQDLEERKAKRKDSGEGEEEEVEEVKQDTSPQKAAQKETEEKKEDVWEPEEIKPATFAEAFSDSDDSEDEESEEDDDEDFSKGINAYLEAVRKRKKERQTEEGSLRPSHVGPENRIVAATTFEKTYVKSREKVNHLTLLTVRKRFRKYGIGKYLVTQVKDPSVVGDYDAVVVHADNSATDFFEKFGFSDDIVLNSRWLEIAEQFTNCTLMSYMPPFTEHNVLNIEWQQPELDLLAMEREIRAWREKSMESYRAEVSCVNRLREEVIHLRALASSQHSLIKDLTIENRRIQDEKNTIERDYLEYRFIAARTNLQNFNLTDDMEIDGEELLKQLEGEVEHRLNERRQSRGKAALYEQTEQLSVQTGTEADVEVDLKQPATSNGSETYRLSSSPAPRGVTSLPSLSASTTPGTTPRQSLSSPLPLSPKNSPRRNSYTIQFPQTTITDSSNKKTPQSPSNTSPPPRSARQSPAPSTPPPPRSLIKPSPSVQSPRRHSSASSCKSTTSTSSATALGFGSSSPSGRHSHCSRPTSASSLPPSRSYPRNSSGQSSTNKHPAKTSTTTKAYNNTPPTSPLRESSFSDKFEFRANAQTTEPLENVEEILKVTEKFLQGIEKDKLSVHQYNVKLVSKAVWLPCQEEEYLEALQSLHEPGMVTRLYYCGSLENPERIKHIFSSGFSKEDFSHGEYGHGLYFSKYPTKAAQFSVLGKLIVAAVGLGETKTLVAKDHTRKAPPEGGDSILTPGRLFSHGDVDNRLCQEYMVFNPSQVRPLYLIEYDAVF